MADQGPMSQCTATNRGGERCDSPRRVTALAQIVPHRTLNPIAFENRAQIIAWDEMFQHDSAWNAVS